MTTDELIQARKAAQKQLGSIPGVQGFGVGGDCVRVYVQSDAVAQVLPRDVAGVPLQAVVAGPIKAQ